MRSTRRGTPRALVTILGFLPGFLVLSPTVGTGLRGQDTGPLTLTPGRILTLVKGDRPAEVQQPYRAIMVEDGRLYLTDSRKGDVLWFDENLVWKGNLAALHPRGSLGQPVRTVADSRGRILVADRENRQIYLFADGELTGTWGGRGDAPGRFDSLDDIAVDVDDMVWAADGGAGVLYVFTPDGLLERVVDGFGGQAFDEPELVAVDPAGGVYVYDAGRKAVLAGTAGGEYRWALPMNPRFGGKDLFDLAVDPTGALFLVIDDDSRVAIVEPTGQVRGEIFGPSGHTQKFDRVTGLSISAARGAMLVVDREDLLVQAFRLGWPDGTAFLEPVSRAFQSFALDTYDGRVLAVSPGDGERPERWLVQDAGGLAVTDADGKRVGHVVGEVAGDPVAAGTADGFVLVGADRSMHLLSKTGEVVSALPRATAGGELKRPAAIAWRASDGALAVYDADDDEIQILTSEGVFQQRVGRKGTGAGEISEAVGLTFTSVGQLLVVDLEGARVQRFDEHGIYVSGFAPPTINRAQGNVALAVGADTWGREFLLDEATGSVVQLGAGRPQCQVGAPWLMRPVTHLAVQPGGDVLVGGGKEFFRTARFRCTGPPPAPRGLQLTLDVGPEGGAILSWEEGTPGAHTFEVFRRERGGEPALVTTASGSSALIPRAAWGRAQGELTIRGVSDRGVPGAASAPVADRLTPALRALTAGGDEVLAAEMLLREELDTAVAEGREDVTALRAAYLQSIVAQGEYERARSELEAFEASLTPEQAGKMRLDIARAAVSGAIRAGAGETAVQWLRPVGELAPESLSPVERLALDLDGAGDTPIAAEMMVRHGYSASLDGIDLTVALAEAQMDAGRPEQAMTTLVDAAAEANGPGQRRQIDREIFLLAAQATEGLLDGTVTGRPDLTPEQQVDVVLRDLQAYAAETDASSAEEWELRLGALAAKPRIHRAIALEGSDFDAAAEMYEAILDETEFLLPEDEMRVRGRLGALALAEGREDDARAAFEQVLQVSPQWEPSEEYFSPSVREFVAGMKAEMAPPDSTTVP